jgi:hypothetical protein
MSEAIDEPIDYSSCTPDQRERVLDALAARANAVHAEMLRVIAATAAHDDFKADGALSMADWLAERYQLSPATARQWARSAEALEAMPSLQAAYASGQIGFDTLVQGLRFAQPADDARVAELLPSLSFAQVEAMAKRRRRVRPAESEDARRRSHLRLVPDRSGLGARLTGFLPTEDAAVVQAALDRRAETVGPDPETRIWTPYITRMADALRDLCADDLAGAAARSADPEASLVIVHVPVEAVRRSAEAPDGSTDPIPDCGSATIDGDPIDGDALQRLLCDTKVEFSVDGPDGTTVGIGRAGRTIPRWLRRRIVAREHGCCRWPGCGRPIRHVHHVQWWTSGGPTDAANLIGLCWHHHHLLHEGGWTATGNADGAIELCSPAGRTVHSRAGPLAA